MYSVWTDSAEFGVTQHAMVVKSESDRNPENPWSSILQDSCSNGNACVWEVSAREFIVYLAL